MLYDMGIAAEQAIFVGGGSRILVTAGMKTVE